MTQPLPKIPLLDGIPDPGFAEVLSSLPVRKYPKGMLIFEQGERSEDVYCVVSGEVEIVRQTEEGELEHVALLAPGTLFGEFSHLTGTPRSTAAVAKEEATLVELGATWLRELGQRHPEVQKRLLDLYRSRVLQNVLASSRLFRTLAPEEIQRFAGEMALRKYRDGEEILREGADDLSVIVIKRGTVVVSKRRGHERVVLGELKTGELLGEMAVITGEPRSASAHASGDVEAMELSGEAFKQLLATHPKLMSALEDLVRSRAEQTRRVLEEVVDEVVGHQWTEEDDAAGILVDSLRAHVTLVEGERKSEGRLKRASLTRWVVERPAGEVPTAAGAVLAVTLHRDRVKELDAAVVKDPLPAKAVAVEDGDVTLRFDEGEEVQSRLTKIVTSLARARVRLFVYPEYDVSKLGVALEFQTRSGVKAFTPLQSLSQTSGRIASVDAWKPGELASLILHHGGKEVAALSGLCLDAREGGTEFQLEYETGDERRAIEEFLKFVARQLGYGQPSAGAAAPAKTARTGPELTKHFPTPAEFFRTYMGSMESGLLRVEAREAIPRGTQVVVQLAIGGERGVRRISLSGLVRDWKNGQAEVELDEISQDLRQKIEQILQTLVAARAEESWKRRKSRLVAKAKAPKPEAPADRRKWVYIGALGLVALGAAWGTNRTSPPPSEEPIRSARVNEAPRDDVLTFRAKEGEITVRSSEIRSLHYDPESGEAVVAASGRSFTLAKEEAQKLPPLVRRQMEKLASLRKKN